MNQCTADVALDYYAVIEKFLAFHVPVIKHQA